MNAKAASIAITIAFVVLAFALCTSCFWLSMIVIPSYDRNFMDFRLKVPWHTEATIGISRWLVRYWYVAVMAVLPVLAGSAFVAYFLRHHTRARTLAWIWCALIILVPLITQLLMFMSVLATQADLADNLSGQVIHK